jgi:hypothetical protein
MAKRPEPDKIGVILPNSLHFKLINQCLKDKKSKTQIIHEALDQFFNLTFEQFQIEQIRNSGFLRIV